MVQKGDNMLCPKCHNMGRVVWISQDERLAGVQCPRSHSQIVRGDSAFGSNARPQNKPEKNMVFIIELEKSSLASTKR